MTCCSLRVNVEHNKAVVSVIVRDPLYTLESVVEIVRLSGRGIYSYAYKRAPALCTENISVLGVGVRNVEPLIYVVAVVFLL